MITQILILIAGLALIIFGADYLVDGASAVARKAGVSEFVIGLTIVGMGTSAPEFVVSIIGALAGNSDVAVGNVLGSNIFNTLLILGLTAIILPIGITRENRIKDIPINIIITVLFLAMGLSMTLFGLGDADVLSRTEGIILLVLFAIYIWSCFKFNKPDADSDTQSDTKEKKVLVSILLIIGGLAGLVIGGRLFVNSATSIASMLGVSDKFIAVTILAGGTSLPELATCVVAAAKKKGQLALGNILGSNIFNVLLILGASAVITPLSFADINLLDAGVLLLSSLLVLTSIVTFRKNQIDRVDGTIMVLIWIGYMAYLILNL